MPDNLARANDGASIDLDSAPQKLTYTGSLVTAITVVQNGSTYVQTLAYNASNQVTSMSAWTKQ